VIPVIERFLQKISVSKNACWNWVGARNSDGYGIIIINYKQVRVHRFIYEYYHGQICPDLQIDHLCRNRICANPDHLEQVTTQENTRRGMVGKHNKHSKGENHYQRKKTHCIHGHEFTEENTSNRKDGTRACKSCHRIREKLQYHQSK
jgi:hypothetical protein